MGASGEDAPPPHGKSRSGVGERGTVSTTEKRGEGRRAGELWVRVGALRIKGRSGASGGPEILLSVWEANTRQLSGAGSPPWSLQPRCIPRAQRLPGRWRRKKRYRECRNHRRVLGSGSLDPWLEEAGRRL